MLTFSYIIIIVLSNYVTRFGELASRSFYLRPCMTKGGIP